MEGTIRRDLASRLSAARRRTFVGRGQELEKFKAALAGGPDSPVLLFVHGPGGVGKSALLRQFAHEAEQAGRLVVQVDGRQIDPSPTGFETEAAKTVSGPPAVLLVDSFEHCQGLEGWLRERFLPGLPERTVVVVAGRVPPGTDWRFDLAWSDALEVVALGPLEPEAAAALVERHGVAPMVRDAVLEFAGGYPLALSLAASVAVDKAASQPDWSPTPDVVSALLTTLIGELPSQKERLALETAAHTLTTTEGLLGAVVGEEHAAEMFTWLRGLPYAEHGRHGLFLHELVAETVDRDLRWRDMRGYEQMHRSAGHYLLQRARTAPEDEAMTAIRALTYLKRYGPMEPYFARVEREGDTHEGRLEPHEHELAVRMTEEVEGERSAEIVRFWLEHQPEAFWAYRSSRTGRLTAFMTWLRLGEPGPETAVDPVAAAAWEHVERTAPMRPGEHLLMSRFMIDPVSYGEVSTVGHLMQLRICRDWIRSRGLAWSFIISPDAALWRGLMHHLGHREFWETAWDRGLTFTGFGCDWRTTPLEIWFDRTQPGALHAPVPERAGTCGTARTLPREAFDGAVRDALKNMQQPSALEHNPLLNSHLVADWARESDNDPVDLLRTVLAEAVEALKEDSRQLKFHAALVTTYLERARTQETAAHRLGLPFSTYRRHLVQGTGLVCARLWAAESASAVTDWPDPSAVRTV